MTYEPTQKYYCSVYSQLSHLPTLTLFFYEVQLITILVSVEKWYAFTKVLRNHRWWLCLTLRPSNHHKLLLNIHHYQYIFYYKSKCSIGLTYQSIVWNKVASRRRPVSSLNGFLPWVMFILRTSLVYDDCFDYFS